MASIVTDPAKIVTDELVLKELARQGIDKDYVEFWHDYSHRGLGKEHNPYAKFYRDLKSSKKIMAVGGLPMVNADGVKICGDSHNETKVGWERKGVKFETKPNIFGATVDGLGVELLTLNDQPWGARKGDSASWEPRLFLNGIEQYPIGAVRLLPIDPLNENYHFNVLEWDYGICKRRIRVIEGRFRERWIFPANPNGDVRIKHGFAGNLKVRLGYALDAEGNPLEIIVTDDEELIPATAFAEAVYPVEIGTSATFYPDASPESTSVDGTAWHTVDLGSGIDWADLVAAAGNNASDYPEKSEPVFIMPDNVSEKWRQLERGIFLYDTSGIPDVAEIEAATLLLFGCEKVNSRGTSPDINIYSSNPASNTQIVAGDYATLGSIPFSSPISYADFNKSGYNDFILNDAGIAVISTISVTKLGARNACYDVANIPPAWVSSPGPPYMDYLSTYFAEKGGEYKPKLVVTYEVPVGLENKSAGMAAKMVGAGLI